MPCLGLASGPPISSLPVATDENRASGRMNGPFDQTAPRIPAGALAKGWWRRKGGPPAASGPRNPAYRLAPTQMDNAASAGDK